MSNGRARNWCFTLNLGGGVADGERNERRLDTLKSLENASRVRGWVYQFECGDRPHVQGMFASLNKLRERDPPMLWGLSSVSHFLFPPILDE